MVGLVSRFSHDPHESHWQASKRILRYIKRTTCYGIHYTSGDPHIVGFTDSDWVGDIDDCKSTSRFVFCLGDGPITWSCKKQHAHTLSSTEVEHREVVLANQEVFWLRKLMTEFGFPLDSPTFLWCDNKSAIHILHNPVEHQSNKHIRLHINFIRRLI